MREKEGMMKIVENEVWDENTGDATIFFDIEDESLNFKAEWQYGCHDGWNVVQGTIGGRKFVWKDVVPLCRMDDNSTTHYEKFFKILVQRQLKEWNLSAEGETMKDEELERLEQAYVKASDATASAVELLEKAKTMAYSLRIVESNALAELWEYKRAKEAMERTR